MLYARIPLVSVPREKECSEVRRGYLLFLFFCTHSMTMTMTPGWTQRSSSVVGADGVAIVISAHARAHKRDKQNFAFSFFPSHFLSPLPYSLSLRPLPFILLLYAYPPSRVACEFHELNSYWGPIELRRTSQGSGSNNWQPHSNPPLGTLLFPYMHDRTGTQLTGRTRFLLRFSES
jgi:hypothetical protein